MKGTPALYHRLVRLLNFKAFVAGFVAVLLLLSVVGRIVASHNIYTSSFQRFHLFIEPESLYYPTASQLREIVKSKLHHHKNGKIAVIVGGSSVFNGVGQSVDHLWTAKLQKLLGTEYVVVNLAFRGGHPEESGNIAAQALIKQGYKKLIYLTDYMSGLSDEPDGTGVQKYLFPDAFYKGMLLHDSLRDQHIQNYSSADPKALMEKRELHLRMWLDSLFYSNDLWGAIAYRWVFTTWNWLAARQPPAKPFQWLQPRILFSDAHNFEGELTTLEQRYPPATETAEMKIVRRTCRDGFKRSGDTWEPNAKFWKIFNHSAKRLYPDQLKKKVLNIVVYESPHYVQQLLEAEQKCYVMGIETTVHRLRNLGLKAIEAGSNFTIYDFNDRVHLAPSGGEKLAEVVAPQLKALAQELGYIKSAH
jgi:hypothetical protein